MESKNEKYQINNDKDQTLSLLNDAKQGNTIKIPEIKKTRSIFYNYYGIFFALLASLSLSMTQIFTKKANFFSGSDIGAFRFFMQLICMLIIAHFANQALLGPKNMRKILLFRGVLGTIGMLSSFYSLKLLNPSDTTALMHLNIVIIPIIARFYLKEKFRIINLLSLILSILVVFFIAQPSFIFKRKNNFVFQNN